jgi:hypothetical protein
LAARKRTGGGILLSENRLTVTKRLEMVMERGLTFQPLNLEMLVRTSNSSIDRRLRIRVSRLFRRKKKEGVTITHKQLHPI